MKSDQIFTRLTIAIACLLLLTAGCAQTRKEITKTEVRTEEQTPKVAEKYTKPQPEPEKPTPETEAKEAVTAITEEATRPKVEPQQQEPERSAEAVKAKSEPEKEKPKVAESEVKKPKAEKPQVAKPEAPKHQVAKPEVAQPKPKAEAVTLTLKFKPQDSTTYKVIMERQRSVSWEGPLPEKSTFQGGSTSNRIEMTFTQQIQSVDDKGNAVAKITVKELKYRDKVKDNVTVDFDSKNIKDPQDPMALLIGQSYTIKIAPTGQVIEIVDVKQADTAVRKGSRPPRTVLPLLSENAIKQRHSIPALPAADKNKLRLDEKWSSVKAFNFGMMGSKAYERRYTLKQIKDVNGRRIAIVDMNAIPSSEMPDEMLKEQAAGFFSKMFDNAETYTGQLRMDLTAGKVEIYLEKLKSEWLAVDPTPKPDEKQPAALKMTATRLFHIEKID